MKRGESVEEMLDRCTMFEPNSGCQIWTAGLTNGYGHIYLPDPSRHERAHVWNYKRLVGPIPDGREPDHLCRVKSCINVRHLEPVTHRENLARAIMPNARKTACPRGHPYDIQTRRERRCRQCQVAYYRHDPKRKAYMQAYHREWKRRRKEQNAA